MTLQEPIATTSQNGERWLYLNTHIARLLHQPWTHAHVMERDVLPLVAKLSAERDRLADEVLS